MTEPTSFEVITEGLQQFAAWATSITLIVAALSAVFKPVRGFIVWLIKKVYGEHKNPALDEIKEVAKKIDSISDRVDKYEISRIRYEVLSFGNECRRGIDHSKEEFDHIIQLNTEYHNLLEKVGKTNGVFDADFEYIMKKYHEHLNNNDFPA